VKAAVVLGTRSEIVKLALLIKEMERRGVDFFILYTESTTRTA